MYSSSNKVIPPPPPPAPFLLKQSQVVPDKSPTVSSEAVAEQTQTVLTERSPNNGRKLKSASTCKGKNCPVHRRKDMNKLEECYWAKWKPSNPKSFSNTRTADFSNPVIPRFPYINSARAFNAGFTANRTCQNCQRLLYCQMQGQTRPTTTFSQFPNQLSSTSDYSDVRAPKGNIYGRKFLNPTLYPRRNEETTECDCVTTPREGETTEVYFTDAGMGANDLHGHNLKETKDKAVCCCQGKKAMVANKAVTTDDGVHGTEEFNYNGCDSEASLKDDQVPVKGPSRAKPLCCCGKTCCRCINQTTVAQVETTPYSAVDFRMEDQRGGSFTACTQTNSESSNAQKTTPLSSNNHSLCDCVLGEDGAKPSIQQIHPNPKNSPHGGADTKNHGKQDGNCQTYDSDDAVSTSSGDHANQLVKYMRRISEYIPEEAQSLVTKMANILTSEPIEDIKRQAEHILESALKAEDERKKHTVKKPNTPRSQSPDSDQTSRPNTPVKKDCQKPPILNCACPRVLNECLLQQEQQRLKRQQEQLTVQDQVRKVQQEQMCQNIQNKRKLLEEQAKEIQRQRSIQKKAELLEQQEEQLRKQSLAQQQRLHQLDAASHRLNTAPPEMPIMPIEKPKVSPTISEKPKESRLSAAVARVTGVLKHSYPLSKGAKRAPPKKSFCTKT